LTSEETSERSRLKNDVALTLLTSISLHMVVMFNEINNFLGLDVILNGEPIGLKNHVKQQHGINIEESSNRINSRS
jgi:hypothetical protein